MKKAAKNMVTRAMQSLNSRNEKCNNISISSLNYGVNATEDFLTELRKLVPADITVSTEGIMGYVMFKRDNR